MTSFRNVVEDWLLYDTVGVFDPPQGSNISTPTGWFTTLAGLGGVSELDFFNVRSRSIGLPYNNQDARDQTPYVFHIDSIGVTYFANMQTQAFEWDHTPENDFVPEDYATHIFNVDVARHVGVILRIQQDDRLKTTSYMCPPGYGPSGDGFGRGSPTTWGELNNDTYDAHASVVSQSSPYLANRWPFPNALQVPRRGVLNVKLKLNEYVRNLITTLPQQHVFFGVDDADDIAEKNVFFGIQVSLKGRREVQQRAEYHA